METTFGKFIKSKGFAYLFLLILLAAVGYLGLRAENAAEWLWGKSLYGPIFGLLALLVLVLAYAQHCGVASRFQRGCKRVSAWFLCFLLYDVLVLLALDLAGQLLDLPQAVRAGLILGAAGLAALLVLGGGLHARRLKTVSYTVPLDVPDTRIVLLSDLHIGIFIGESYLQRVAAVVNRLEPDLVMISGDLFDGYLPADDGELRRIAAVFWTLRAPGGVYAVLGNHDPAVTDPRLRRFVEDAGMRLLYNEAVELPTFHLVGRAGIVDLKGLRVPLDRLMQGLDARKPTIVLDHDPQGIREAAACGADLVLCGHTHRGQFFPMDLLTRWANGRAYFYGAGVSGRTCSVISAGTGFFQLPIRIGTDSEVVVLDCRREPS